MSTTTVGEIRYNTVIDTAGYRRGAKEVNQANKDMANSTEQTSSGMSRAWSVISKGVILGATAAGASIVALSVASIKGTAALEQSLGGSEVVFGEFSEKIQKLAKESAMVMGTSQREYLDTANKMASLFQGAGFTVEKSFNLTTAAMQRATDVATAMGISTEMALESISGAAKGNFTMMDNLGVAMNDTTLNAYALEKSIGKTTQQMTNAEKVGLAMQLFMEKTAKFSGNYARENDTLAGSFQTLKGAWGNFLSGVEGSDKQLVESGKNMTRVLGREIPRIMDNLIKGISGVYGEMRKSNPEFRRYSDIAESVYRSLGEVVQVIRNLSPIIITATAAWAGYAIAVGAVRVATQLYTAAQLALNAAMKANPIGLLIGALTGLIAIFALVSNSSNSAKSAQDRLNVARDEGKRLNDALKASEDALKDSQLQVEGSTLALERAEINLTRAEREYGKGSLEAREAALQLKNAQRDLEQANKAVKTATDENTKAQKDFAKGKDEIVKAQNEVAWATGNAANQYKILADSAKNAKKAQDEIAKQGGKATPSQQLNSAGIPAMRIPGRAMGGRVSANQPYFVGENSDGSLNSTSELFVPKSSGSIINSSDLQDALGSGGGRIEYNIANINISSEVDGERWIRRLTNNQEIVSNGLVPFQTYMGGN